jgi:hypothetical protein
MISVGKSHHNKRDFKTIPNPKQDPGTCAECFNAFNMTKPCDDREISSKTKQSTIKGLLRAAALQPSKSHNANPERLLIMLLSH